MAEKIEMIEVICQGLYTRYEIDGKEVDKNTEGAKKVPYKKGDLVSIPKSKYLKIKGSFIAAAEAVNTNEVAIENGKLKEENDKLKALVKKLESENRSLKKKVQ